MKKILFILLLSVYIIGCSSNQYKRDVNGQIEATVFQSPEQVIEEYYAALERGDEDFLNELFVKDEKLRVVKPIPDITYSIKGGKIITENEARERNRTSSENKLAEGDLEVIVEEILNNNTEEITFILRRVNSRWKIYSHSIGYYI